MFFIERAAFARFGYLSGAMLRHISLLLPAQDILLMHAADAETAHVLVLADLILGELPVLSEYDVEAHPEDADEYDCK